MHDYFVDLGSCSSRDAHSEQCTRIFKDLCTVSEEVKTFVINCCKDQWIQAAIMMGDQVEYVCLLSSQLDFCAAVFGNSCLITGTETTSYMPQEIDHSGIIRDKALRDREKLLSVLSTLDPI